ncbi:Short-chain dehydrogenase TIC 32, partial [Lathyrus oleraceus]
NNAGIMACPFKLSKDNIELQFATNHIGHFLLTNLLLDTMKKTTRESKKEGRIVNVASEAHRFAYPEGIRFDKINDQSSYNNWRAYGQSKLANVLHANQLTKHLKVHLLLLYSGVIYMPYGLVVHNWCVFTIVQYNLLCLTLIKKRMSLGRCSFHCLISFL